jgi:hypothetical protein
VEEVAGVAGTGAARVDTARSGGGPAGAEGAPR